MAEGVYKQRVRGRDNVHEAHVGRWRCTCWPDKRSDGTPMWSWEARRFGQHSLHVSGECKHLKHAKRIALAAARALTRSR